MDLATDRTRRSTSSESAAPLDGEICAHCVFADVRRLRFASVCKHPSREFSDHPLFGGDEACRAFLPRSGAKDAGRVTRHVA